MFDYTIGLSVIIIITILVIIYVAYSKDQENLCGSCLNNGEMNESIIKNPFLRPASKCTMPIVGVEVAENRDPDNASNYFNLHRRWDHKYLTS